MNDADVGIGEPGVAGSPLEGCLRRSGIVKAHDYLVFQHDSSFPKVQLTDGRQESRFCDALQFPRRFVLKSALSTRPLPC